MEYWSVGVLRRVRIAPAQRVGGAEGATAFSSGILCPAETQEWPDKETCAG